MDWEGCYIGEQSTQCYSKEELVRHLAAIECHNDETVIRRIEWGASTTFREVRVYELQTFDTTEIQNEVDKQTKQLRELQRLEDEERQNTKRKIKEDRDRNEYERLKAKYEK